MLFAGRKKKEEKPKEEESVEETQQDSKESEEKEASVAQEIIKPMMIVMPPMGGGGETPRCLGLIGDITEEKSELILSQLVGLNYKGMDVVPVDPKNPTGEMQEVYEPVEMMISTHGGSASDMFAIYDVMKLLQDSGMEVQTVGIGKVMSAGVLLLAAGTPGKRSIGKHCRVMIHGVSSGAGGMVESIDNELEEIKLIEDQYITALAENTAMTKRYIKNRLKKRLNVYIGAEEAVELGIADNIF